MGAQVDNYRAFAEQRAAQLGTTLEALLTGDGAAGDHTYLLQYSVIVVIFVNMWQI